MRVTVEPHCNLTLTRTQWSTLIGLLDRKATPQASSVVQAIRAALRDAPDAHLVSIDREVQKWSASCSWCLVRCARARLAENCTTRSVTRLRRQRRRTFRGASDATAGD